MSLILNIDTALDIASVCLAKEEEVLGMSVNENQNDHAAWLHMAIAETLQKCGYGMQDIKAVAVSIGPGSYTGLRVGLSTAKGLCYAQHIPLITIGTLDMMAFAAKDGEADLLCPMIDARRMEVFTAVYDKKLNQLYSPRAMIINKNSFAELLSSNSILFSGNGSKKLEILISHKNARFSSMCGNSSHLAQLSYKKFLQNEFAGLAYTEPLYIKEFYFAFRKPSV